MNQDSKRGDHDKKADKKKYVKPKLSRHGSLQGIAERVTGRSMSPLCCLTERLVAARRSPAQRSALLKDLARVR